MKKNLKIAVLAAMMTLGLCITAFAGQWMQDSTGWWWERDNGSYPTSGWVWIDDNYDGVSERYYFNRDGYCLLGTTTPDGYTVNSSGAWVVDGVVQHDGSASPYSDTFTHADIYGTYEMYLWDDGSVSQADVEYFPGPDVDHLAIGNVSIGGTHYYVQASGDLVPAGGESYTLTDSYTGVKLSVTFSYGKMTVKILQNTSGRDLSVLEGTYLQSNKPDLSHTG